MSHYLDDIDDLDEALEALVEEREQGPARLDSVEIGLLRDAIVDVEHYRAVDYETQVQQYRREVAQLRDEVARLQALLRRVRDVVGGAA